MPLARGVHHGPFGIKVFNFRTGRRCQHLIWPCRPVSQRSGNRSVSVTHAGRLTRVEIAVTAIGADGTVRQAIVESTGRIDADWWEQLAASAHLEVPPPYRPEPGQPVYEIRAGEHVAQVAEQDLAGPLQELVTAVLAEGGGGG